jgi:predicted CXXCH cytochrome family protein
LDGEYVVKAQATGRPGANGNFGRSAVRPPGQRWLRMAATWGFAAFLFGVLAFAFGHAMAAAPAATGDSCIGCHGEKALVGKNDRKVYIDPAVFAATTHGQLGCTSCHARVTTAHPGDGKAVTKAECKGCHDEASRDYQSSKHANFAACTDCHNPHDVKGPEVVTAVQMNGVCGKCHAIDGLMEKHRKWLPQTGFHLAAVPCVACHTGSTDYVVTMYLERRLEDGRIEPFPRTVLEHMLVDPNRKISTLVDANEDGVISLEELRSFNLNSRSDGVRLQAAMMPGHVTHTYQILRNRYDCTFCHASGPRARQKSFMAFPEAGDQRFQRVPVEDGAVLDLLYGTPDFYMIGASESRSFWINLIGLGFVLVGVGFAGMHTLFRLRSRKNRAPFPKTGKRVYLTPLPVRIWHWANAAAIIMLVLTGLEIRFPNQAPIFGGYKQAVMLHNMAGLFVTFCFVWWAVYYLFISRKLFKLYVPTLTDLWPGTLRQAVYYLYGYFKGKAAPYEPAPDNKFNPLQKSFYMFLMFVVMPLVCATGLVILNLEPLRQWLFAMGGVKMMVSLHYLTGNFIVMFLFVHIYLSTMGRSFWDYLHTMWTGWEEH